MSRFNLPNWRVRARVASWDDDREHGKRAARDPPQGQGPPRGHQVHPVRMRGRGAGARRTLNQISRSTGTASQRIASQLLARRATRARSSASPRARPRASPRARPRRQRGSASPVRKWMTAARPRPRSPAARPRPSPRARTRRRCATRTRSHAPPEPPHPNRVPTHRVPTLGSQGGPSSIKSEPKNRSKSSIKSKAASTAKKAGSCKAKVVQQVLQGVVEEEEGEILDGLLSVEGPIQVVDPGCLDGMDDETVNSLSALLVFKEWPGPGENWDEWYKMSIGNLCDEWFSGCTPAALALAGQTHAAATGRAALALL